jgi:hypothetical protein
VTLGGRALLIIGAGLGFLDLVLLLPPLAIASHGAITVP